MKILVTGAVGGGKTELSAFDNALIKMGVANFNLIRLSSVIPPSSEVLTAELSDLEGNWGDRLYCVYAENRTSVPGESIYAGIGWVTDSQGKGLFVEHEGHSEEEVSSLIDSSLGDLMAGRGMAGLKIQKKITGGQCVGDPVCALVIASYKVQDWYID